MAAPGIPTDEGSGAVPADTDAPIRERPTATPESPAARPVETVVDEWLADTDNYNEIVDMRGDSIVLVVVGAPGNGGYHAFDPPAIRVSAGTQVTWLWNGPGGLRDVVAVDGRFVSPLVDRFAYAYSYRFDGAAVIPYYSSRYRHVGMKGVVIVDRSVQAGIRDRRSGR